MSFLAPWWLAGAAVLAASVVVLHLLARRRPRPLIFPTARFIPDRPATAASLAPRPTDRPLLFYRLLLVLLLAMAFAQPVLAPPRKTTGIVLLDQSRVAPPPDSTVLSILGSADRVIGFDSGAARGSISAALITALRTAAELDGNGDSVSLTMISPFTADEFDAATLRIRHRWEGQIALVPVPAQSPALITEPVSLPPDDPLAAAISLANPDRRFPGRLVRNRATADDSTFARQGGALVIWPRALTESGWPAGQMDSIGGVMAARYAVAAVFPRVVSPPAGSIAAAWADGEPAATTVPFGSGCIRHVAVSVPESGDLVVRSSFVRFTRVLLAPCDGGGDVARVEAPLLDSLRGSTRSGSSVLAAGTPGRQVPVNRWFLIGAAILFSLEPLVRRRSTAQ